MHDSNVFVEAEVAVTTPAYVLITPARNESQFIELTIKSVTAQTVRPTKWVIVSDGSTDGTDDIVRNCVVQHDWIELVRLPEHSQRSFAGKVDAFNAGHARVAGLEYDVIGNLDADVSFEEDYLAFLVAKFAENPVMRDRLPSMLLTLLMRANNLGRGC